MRRRCGLGASADDLSRGLAAQNAYSTICAVALENDIALRKLVKSLPRSRTSGRERWIWWLLVAAVNGLRG